jgi:3-oxoadipate enol-lactonase
MLDYRTHGSRTRPALTLLHAGGMTRQEWDPFLEAWSRRFFLVTPTALGHGASPKVAALDFREMAEAVIEVLRAEGIRRTHLLGSSMGGATALAIALDHPERVDRLGLFRCNYRTTPSMRRELARMVEPETWRRWGMEKRMREQHLPQGGPDAWIEVSERVIALVDPAKTADAFDPADLARTAARTLIIVGDRDPLVPLDDALRMHRTIPDCALWVLPGADHVPATEGWRRPIFESEVLHFFARR